MNKKGISKLGIILIVIVCLIVIAFLLIYVFKFDIKSIFSSNKATGKGVVFDWSAKINDKALNPAFKYLFGINFKSSVSYVLGTDAGIGDWFYYMTIGLGAVIFITLVNLMIVMLTSILNWGNYWKSVRIRGTKGALKYVGLIVIYPTLMCIGIIGPFIRIATFYYFVSSWWIKCIVLAVYVFYLPQIIEGIIYWNERRKAQKAIFDIRVGQEKFRAAGASR